MHSPQSQVLVSADGGASWTPAGRFGYGPADGVPLAPALGFGPAVLPELPPPGLDVCVVHVEYRPTAGNLTHVAVLVDGDLPDSNVSAACVLANSSVPAALAALGGAEQNASAGVVSCALPPGTVGDLLTVQLLVDGLAYAATLPFADTDVVWDPYARSVRF